jgi:hypothetical protein
VDVVAQVTFEEAVMLLGQQAVVGNVTVNGGQAVIGNVRVRRRAT